MGTIRTEVREQYLDKYPEEENLLKPFLDGFHITWAKKSKNYNTELTTFFLSPEQHYKEAYGFENEILLVYAPYDRMEPRTLQAVEQILSMSPAKGRVETLNYFIISQANDVREWLDSYNSSRQESRIIVAFTKEELLVNIGNNYFVRNRLDEQFFGRDLFNYSLPLVEDTYFFGRQNLLMEYYDSIRRCENKAIFGLRKTGKTSFLFKLRRLCENEKAAVTIYLDCKQPHIRKSRWNELLEDIGHDICKNFGLTNNFTFSEKKASKSFFEIIENVYKKNGRICLIFDEIEYVSFVAQKDPHWHEDFIEFWQTLWSCQSQYKCLCYLIAGVNPTVVEKDTVNMVQNPLFGIVSHRYMTGFTIDEVSVMLKKLGKRMGLKFTPSAISKIHKWYGGHPLLTRLACSSLNTFLSSKQDKPIDITDLTFEQQKSDIDRELIFYCTHAVSELRQFYEDEYFMFELLATGQELEFKQLSRETSYLKHLLDYGLVEVSSNNYSIKIPVIGKRVAIDSANSEKRNLIYPIVVSDKRSSWLNRRKEEILNDIRVFEKLIKDAKKTMLFGVNSFPEADSFKDIIVSTSKESFSYFVNVLSRCFVESIESYGKELNKQKYFWNEIKDEYPSLWPVLHRIKVYRNERDHLDLTTKVNEDFLAYLKEDFEGKSFSNIDDPYFVIQQRILDRLLLGILQETDKIN